MIEQIPHIISPLSAGWCGWTLFALFLCAILSELMQPGVIIQAHSSLFAHTDRTYKDAPTNTLGQMAITIFRIGTLAIAICLSFYTGGPFRFVSFAAISGLILVLLLIKMLCNSLLDYTFSLSRRFMPMYEQYGNMATIASYILYPCLLIMLRIGKPEWVIWVLGGTTILFLLMCIYRMARTYIQSPMAIVYVALYLCTMEALPLGILFYLSSKIILYI